MCWWRRLGMSMTARCQSWPGAARRRRSKAAPPRRMVTDQMWAALSRASSVSGASLESKYTHCGSCPVTACQKSMKRSSSPAWSARVRLALAGLKGSRADHKAPPLEDQNLYSLFYATDARWHNTDIIDIRAERQGEASGVACNDVEGRKTRMAAPVSFRRWSGALYL